MANNIFLYSFLLKLWLLTTVCGKQRIFNPCWRFGMTFNPEWFRENLYIKTEIAEKAFQFVWSINNARAPLPQPWRRNHSMNWEMPRQGEKWIRYLPTEIVQSRAYSTTRIANGMVLTFSPHGTYGNLQRLPRSIIAKYPHKLPEHYI